MASNLEGLIAKGRRVTHIREQREVAFGLADLSTHSELHERIVLKGGIKTLLHILNHSRDVEAQRFAVLSMANITARSHVVRVNMAQDEKVVFYLLEYMKSEENDTIAKQYCAMAIGNLAVSRETHSIVMESYGISILVAFLRFGTNDQNYETTQYAAFALSNLASNEICCKEISNLGALESLVLAACFDDTDVQRHALTALRGICKHSDYHSEAISVGILDPLILLARSVEINISQDVAALLNCLSSTVGIRMAISDRAASSILHLSLSEETLTKRHATCAIANLTEVLEIHKKLMDESVLAPLEAIISSTDLNSKGQACRALANLSTNVTLHSILSKERMIGALVNALGENELNCQRFSALCLANLSRTVRAQSIVTQMGSVRCLNGILSDVSKHLDARKYSCLAIANLSATKINHPLLLREESLGAILSLSHSDDIQSKYYVGAALSNLGSNVDNHSIMVEEGCIQPLISLLYDKDISVHKLACSALCGLSCSENFIIKIIQEGGLQPLADLLQSKDMLLLREACCCVSNISVDDEGKIEMVNCGIIKPLVILLQQDDPFISSYCAAALANLADIHSNKSIIASLGAIKPCIALMVSQNVDAQREGGRLLANLCSCDSMTSIDFIFECGGHHLLTSYLLSSDIYSKQIGAFGICCLCIHQQHRVTLKDKGVLDPLSLIVQSNEASITIKKFALLALVYLSSENDNHNAFLDASIFNTAFSLSASADAYIRVYSALIIANLGRNMRMTKVLSVEGGLEPILYLARLESTITRREALPAIANLSFLPEHRDDICSYGGLFSIFQELQDEGTFYLRYACCAVANLAEQPKHAEKMVEAGVLELLTKTTILTHDDALCETARALGNLATNICYSKKILSQQSILHPLLNAIQSNVFDSRHMAMMALSNLCANSKCHGSIIDMGILEVIKKEFQISLDCKRDSDHQTTRFLLLLVSNLCTNTSHDEKVIMTNLDNLVKFSNHRDIKCRQNAIIVIGNLCSNEKNVNVLKNTRVPTILISNAFPSKECDSSNSHLQAIAGLRGLAINEHIRTPLVESGCCEPLTLSLCSHDVVNDEIRYETAATLYNLTLSKLSSLSIVKAGVVHAILSSLEILDDSSKVFAVGILANLAEKCNDVQFKLIDNGCIPVLSEILNDSKSSEKIIRDVIRCFALLASNVGLHDMMLSSIMLKGLVRIVSSEFHGIDCKVFATVTIANLASRVNNHRALMECGVLSSLHSLQNAGSHQLGQSLAFVFHNVAKNLCMHQFCYDHNIASTLSHLILSEDNLCKLHACLALRYLSISESIGRNIIDHGHIPKLLQVLRSSSIEHMREVVGSIRNLSVSNVNKQLLLELGCISALLDISRCSDSILAQQIFATLANLAEEMSNRMKMIEHGILHHLKHALTYHSEPVIQESIRAISNLSTDKRCIRAIEKAGLSSSIISLLSSNQISSHIFSAITILNLTTDEKVREALIIEGCIDPLFYLYSGANGAGRDDITALHCFTALSNLAASSVVHETLLNCKIVQMCCLILEEKSNFLMNAALSCLANLASQSRNHSVLQVTRSSKVVLEMLDYLEETQLYHAVLFLRGISTSPITRKVIFEQNVVHRLLSLMTIEHDNIHNEVLHTLCNLSIDAQFHNHIIMCLNRFQSHEVVNLFHEEVFSSKLFGVIIFGNGILNNDFRDRISIVHVLDNLILEYRNGCHDELGRCIAYSLCNLSEQIENRSYLVRSGGLIPILFLTKSKLENDVYNALCSIRALCTDRTLATLMVENTCLEYLLDVSIRNLSDRCTEEALKAIYFLSLNDSNKKKIIQYQVFESTMNLTCISVQIVTLFTALLASCSEIHILHSHIIEYIHSITLHQVEELSCYKQYTRLVSNLCANKENNVWMLDTISVEIISKCVTFDNFIVQRNILLVMYNVCINDTLCDQIHQLILTLSPRLIEYITLKDPLDHDISLASFACLTIGSLLKIPLFWTHFCDLGTFDLLQAIFSYDNDELKYSASFSIYQYFKYAAESNRSFIPANTIYILLNELKIRDKNFVMHLVSAVRYLGKDYEVSRKIVDNRGLEILSELNVESVTLELKREIAGSFYNLTMSPSLIEKIVSSAAFGTILKLVSSTDIECARFSIAALANILEDHSTHSYILRVTNIITELIDAITSKPLQVKREAARCLSNLLSNYDSITTFINHKGLQALDLLSKISDTESQLHCAVSLRKLASVDRVHNYFVSYRSLDTMFRLIGHEKDNLEGARLACMALYDYASSSLVEKIILENCDYDRFLYLLSSEDSALKSLGAAILYRISVSFKLKQKLLIEGILPLLFKCIDDNDDMNLLIHVSAVLSNLSESEEGRLKLWGDEKFKKALHQLAIKGISSILVNVARCMSFLSISVPNYTFPEIDITIMMTAIKMISIDQAEAAVIEYALMTIGNLVRDLKYQSIACNLNAFEHVATLIIRNSEHLALAMWVLSRIMILDEHTHLCFKQKNLLGSIVCCLKAKTMCVLYNTCCVLCNVSSNSFIPYFLGNNVVKDLMMLIQENCTQSGIQTATAGIKVLCNITAFREIRKCAITGDIISMLLMLCKIESMNVKEIALMTLSNLSIDGFNIAPICSANAVPMMCCIYDGSSVDTEKNAVAMNLFNLSLSQESHVFLGTSTVIKCLFALCNSEMKLCRLLSIMTLSNISGNDCYCKNVIQNGGLKFAIIMSNDSDIECRACALIFLSNLTISSSARYQAVLHGCLPPLKSALESGNENLRQCARLAIVNLVSDSKNIGAFFDQNVLCSFLNESEDDMSMIAFTFINVLISDYRYYSKYLFQIWRILTEFVKCNICHFSCAAIAAVKQLVMRGMIPSCSNWQYLIHSLNDKAFIDEVGLQREIARLLDIISNKIEEANLVAKYCTSSIHFLSQQEDIEILTCIAVTIANLAENCECRSIVPSVSLAKYTVPLFQHKSINVKRNAYRALASLSADIAVQDYFIANVLSFLFSACEFNDIECEYFFSITCRNLSDSGHFNSFVSEHKMPYICRMLGSVKEETVINILMVLKTLISKSSNRIEVEKLDMTNLRNFLESENMDIQTLSVSIFCELTNDSTFRKVIMMDKSILRKATDMIRSSSNVILLRVTELLANLSEDVGNRIEMVDSGVISMLLVLSGNSDINILRHVSRALANLALHEFTGLGIYQQGGLSCIVNLILTSDCTCVTFAGISLNLLYTNRSVRTIIIDSDHLHHMECIFSTDSTTCQFFSAMLLALTSLNEQNRYHLAYHLLPLILRLSTNEDLKVQIYTLMALANLAESSNVHHILIKGSTVVKMACMASNIFDSLLIREWTRLFATLSINDTAREEMLSNKVDSFLIKFGRRAGNTIQRYIVVSICNLCLYFKKKHSVIGNESLLRMLSFLCKSADLDVERGAILSYSALALGASKHSKEDLSSKGVFDLILDALQYPDVPMKQCASIAMNALILGDVQAIKMKLYDNPRGIAILLSLLNSADDECIHNAVYIIGSLIEVQKLRSSIVDMKLFSHIPRIFSSSSIHNKRVCGYVYSILSEEKEYHSLLKNTGAIQDAVNLAGMVDDECQFYGTFALFHLASNPVLQKPIAAMGTVRNLVSILATEAMTSHCAGLTLLRLADNFENHIIIAEEGGIDALIKLGKRNSKNNTLRSKATTALSNLASETLASLPKITSLERDKLNNRK